MDFVFGLSNVPKRSGIISLHRLTTEFDGTGEALGAPMTANKKIFLHRTCNLLVHEIGHMFGLVHCFYYECLLNGTNGTFE